MKEFTEKRIPMSRWEDPDVIVGKIEDVGKEMHKQGWFFTYSQADELLESIVLFFERDVDVS